MAPLVAEGKVLVGNSGGEMGVRGWLTALDAGSGKIVWRAYSTGPDKDVLIGPDYRAPYAAGPGHGPRRHQLAAGKLEDRRRDRLGLDQLRSAAQDDLLRHVQSRARGIRSSGPGDNKWTAGVFARDIDTGQARWFYQSTPHDLYDHDDINEIMLVDYPAP